MQSLVLGATGIVGGYIVQHLLLLGEKPIALSRSPPKDSGGAQWVSGDLADPTALKFPQIEIIYCTVEVGLLVQALPHLLNPSLKRVVAFTSTSIVTKMDSELASERESMRRWAEAEQKLIAICERLGIEWTILRPTIIYAEGRDGNVTRLARLIQRFGFLPLAGRGTGLRQPVHAEDLAIGAINAAAQEAAINKIYVLPGRDIISYREMVGRIFDGLQRPRRIVSVPPSLWKLAFLSAKPFFPNANAAMGTRMTKDMVFDGSQATRDFNWKPREFRPRFEGMV
jgi:uncharacterized protein YbjT (DUF2867 family)